jgi:hypothetical protein
LWENFIISERVKAISFQNLWLNKYFWRTHAQQEIDYIEEYDGQINAYEFKWNMKKVRRPTVFLRSYPNSNFMQVSQDNFLDFLNVN